MSGSAGVRWALSRARLLWGLLLGGARGDDIRRGAVRRTPWSTGATWRRPALAAQTPARHRIGMNNCGADMLMTVAPGLVRCG